MHKFSNLFDKLHVSDVSTVHHQEYLNTVYTQQVFVMLVLLAVCQRGQTTLADANRTSMTDTSFCIYSAEILLMMKSGPVRNMQSTLSNEFEELCISLVFITRILLMDLQQEQLLCQSQLLQLKCTHSNSNEWSLIIISDCSELDALRCVKATPSARRVTATNVSRLIDIFCHNHTLLQYIIRYSDI